MMVNDPAAPVPAIDSLWCWEHASRHAVELVRVAEVIWNGEQWWVRTVGPRVPKLPAPRVLTGDACVPVGASRKALTMPAAESLAIAETTEEASDEPRA